jgi:hypothetical protein
MLLGIEVNAARVPWRGEARAEAGRFPARTTGRRRSVDHVQVARSVRLWSQLGLSSAETVTRRLAGPRRELRSEQLVKLVSFLLGQREHQGRVLAQTVHQSSGAARTRHNEPTIGLVSGRQRPVC